MYGGARISLASFFRVSLSVVLFSTCCSTDALMSILRATSPAFFLSQTALFCFSGSHRMKDIPYFKFELDVTGFTQ
ncbi:hypothetical protein B0T19DRAFT_415138 [Cercophora scortea]|uniref:Secreted protein n=1 Tax=Cercophora scortea TaxID=314031 RepID=A0AAE0IVW5_9PEZI|nr:hypothetical protein B0T19DRAFT_415138 [Cercophora scortea]